jgi:hypothetical protein
MEVQAPTNNKADQAVARKAASLERTKKLREKERQQAEFITNCTLADVLVDARNPKSLKGSTDTTVIQSIKGVCPNLLEHNVLRQFMTINKLQNYQNKSKSKMCRMIVERKKNENLDQIMYADGFDGSDEDDDVDDSWDVEEDTAVGGMKTRRRKGCPRGQSLSIHTVNRCARELMSTLAQRFTVRIDKTTHHRGWRPFTATLNSSPVGQTVHLTGFHDRPGYNTSQAEL